LFSKYRSFGSLNLEFKIYLSPKLFSGIVEISGLPLNLKKKPKLKIFYGCPKYK
jgi:hypothetical protein